MSITLTKWWETLTDDLARLAPKVSSSSQSEPWKAAITMAKEGAQIENGIFTAYTHGNAVLEASKKLAPSFQADASGTIQYLPDVNDKEQLLFSIVYYQHLLRYNDILSSLTLAQGRIDDQKPLVQQNAIELKRRIETYIANPENTKVVEAAYPALHEQPGETLFEKLKHFLAEPTVEDKLVAQFEADAKTVINDHNHAADGINQLFINLDSRLSTKENTLRNIVIYKKLIESLADDSLSPEALDSEDATQLQRDFPNFAEKWLALNNTIPKPSLTTNLAVSVARVAMNVLTRSVQAIRWSMGMITPTFISDSAANIVGAVSGLAEAITPDSNLQRKKDALTQAAERTISTLATSLNSPGESSITDNDFKKIASKDVAALADKVSTIRHMLNIQKCLEEYRAEHTTGLVKFSLTGIFKTITVLMSQSFLRPLLYEKVLLTLEAEKLEKTLDGLISETQNNNAFDKSLVTRNLSDALENTTTTTSTIKEKSMYLFFKKDSQAASAQLQEVVKTAQTKSPSS